MSNSTIKFAYEKGFFTCENDVFKLPLTPTEKLTYILLVRYADSNHRAWPSYERLAREVGCSRRQVIKCVRSLNDNGLLKKEARPNQSNVYLIYPSRFFKVNTVHQRSEFDAPQGVITHHPGSEFDTPNNEQYNYHFINNNLSSEEREIYKTKTNEIFKRNNFALKQEYLDKLETEHSLKDIYAAATVIDFSKAINPVAVLNYLLSTGTFPDKSTAPSTTKRYTLPEIEEVDDDTKLKYIDEMRKIASGS